MGKVRDNLTELALRRRCAALTARECVLLDALRKYGEHTQICERFPDRHWRPCTCGLAALVAQPEGTAT